MGGTVKEKLDHLSPIYQGFAAETSAFHVNAACSKGCAFCCTKAGSIDITTLEGLHIQNTLSRLLRARRIQIKKALAREMKKREAGSIVPCPFLQKNHTCMIYSTRPFACRRIYSLHHCSEQNPPRLSRQYMTLAQETLNRLRLLDEHGYSGHISYILHLLEMPQFRETYLAGEYKPEEILAYGKSHRLVMNKAAAGK